jgi:hypothetical protein
MAPGKKTGGRQRGSKNKRTLALEAEAAAAVAADGNPRAVPALTAILKHYLDKVAAEKAKPDGGNEAVISAALMEARITAAALAPYQFPRLSAVAVGAVTKMTVQVVGGIPARKKSAIAPPTQIEPPRVTDPASRSLSSAVPKECVSRVD